MCGGGRRRKIFFDYICIFKFIPLSFNYDCNIMDFDSSFNLFIERMYHKSYHLHMISCRYHFATEVLVLLSQ